MPRSSIVARYRDMMILAGRSVPDLAKAMASKAETDVTEADIGSFPDGEIQVKLGSDVRGTDLFLVQSLAPPVNDRLVELLLMIDAARRASAARVTAVVPYYAYARQDRKDEGRVPISAKMVANMITKAGADRVITIDLHAAQIQGFFDIPVDHLYGSAVFLPYFKDLKLENPVILAPDIGSTKRALAYGKRLECDIAIIDKRRQGPDHVEKGHVIGEIGERDVIIIDDMIATGGSIVQACELAKENGAQKIYVAATHPVFAGPALERLKALPKDLCQQVIVTDTIPIADDLNGRIKVLSVDALLAEAIVRVHENRSVSMLFQS